MGEVDALAVAGRSLAQQSHTEYHMVIGLDSPAQLPWTAISGEVSTKKGPLTSEVICGTECIPAPLYCASEHVKTMVLLGHPLRAVRRNARRNPIDLIVVGDRGLALEEKSGERLWERAPCTVRGMLLPKDKPKRQA